MRVIHALSRGYPLCRFHDGPPINWPQGHVWVEADPAIQLPAEDNSFRQDFCKQCLMVAQTTGRLLVFMPVGMVEPPKRAKTRYDHINDDDVV